MPRGGYRENAGRKKKWNYGKTRSIRVPIALADQILELAHQLDDGNSQFVSSVELNLSGVRVIYINHKKAIYLSDLLQKGYKIFPVSLSDSVEKDLLLT